MDHMNGIEAYRIGDRIAELAAIPEAHRTPAQNYQYMALTLAAMMAYHAAAAALDHIAAVKAEEPGPPRDEAEERAWDMLCRRGPEILRLFGTDARERVPAP